MFDNRWKKHKMDIIIISIQPWYYELGSNCKNIALELSKKHRVLYVNSPVTRRAFFSKNKTKGLSTHCNYIRERKNFVEQVSNNLWQLYPCDLIESINWLPATAIFRPINYINNRRFYKNISDGIEKLGFQNPILFNDNDIYNGFYLKKLLSPQLYIYYMRDFLQGYDFCKKHTSVLEPELIAQADISLTNSVYYEEYCKQFNNNTSYIGQGCKLELFQTDRPYELPQEIQSLSRPVIGYTGALDSTRLDPEIIQLIAEHDKNWQIVLVGPEDEAFSKSSLHTISNIHFIGRKNIEELPAFISSFDVCINPQLINIVTMGNYPLKIDEYLAMGKPVVATKTKAMELFQDYTYLAEKPADYPALIQKALKESSESHRNRCISFARSHTWENSVELLYESIQKFKTRNNSSYMSA